MDERDRLTMKYDLRQATLKEAVYGPVRSRRLGQSLGINLNLRGTKICTFDCVYCQFGHTHGLVSSPAEVTDWLGKCEILEEIETRFRRLSEQDLELNSITFSGYGEPTLYPFLKEVVIGVKELRDQYYPGVAVDILTNSSNIQHESVFQALTEFDSVMAKLDAGSQEAFQAISRPASRVPPLEDIVRSLVRLQHATNKVAIQTLIFKSGDPDYPDNSGKDEIRLIADMARLVDPVEIQIYTVERQPSESYVEPIETTMLQEATDRINDFIGKECARMYS